MGYDYNECWACYAMGDGNNYGDDYFPCCSKCLVQFGEPNDRMSSALQQNGRRYGDCALCGVTGGHQLVSFCRECVARYDKSDKFQDGECLVCHFEEKSGEPDLDPCDMCNFCLRCFQGYAAKLTSGDKARFVEIAGSVHQFNFDRWCDGCSCECTAYRVRVCERHFHGSSTSAAAAQ